MSKFLLILVANRLQFFADISNSVHAVITSLYYTVIVLKRVLIKPNGVIILLAPVGWIMEYRYPDTTLWETFPNRCRNTGPTEAQTNHSI